MTQKLPKYYETFLNILDILKEPNNVLYHKDIYIQVREKYYSKLSNDLLAQKTSTEKNVLSDRIGWGISYLSMANYVIRPKRAHYQITQKGIEALEKKELSLETLISQPEFEKYKNRSKQKNTKASSSIIQDFITDGEDTPDDLIDKGIQSIQSQVKKELLARIKEVNPYQFEEIVLKLFQAMGFGEAKTTKKSGDGGIDGIIHQDKLGLDKIYVQAKRFTNSSVGEPAVRDFIGAMSGKTSKGIFVTTSDFDEKAKQKAKETDHTIRLIDGEELVKMMYSYNVGVKIKSYIEIKNLDEDFFDNS